jgi:hypothetical protein
MLSFLSHSHFLFFPFFFFMPYCDNFKWIFFNFRYKIVIVNKRGTVERKRERERVVISNAPQFLKRDQNEMSVLRRVVEMNKWNHFAIFLFKPTGIKRIFASYSCCCCSELTSYRGFSFLFYFVFFFCFLTKDKWKWVEEKNWSCGPWNVYIDSSKGGRERENIYKHIEKRFCYITWTNNRTSFEIFSSLHSPHKNW